MFILTFIDLEY